MGPNRTKRARRAAALLLVMPAFATGCLGTKAESAKTPDSVQLREGLKGSPPRLALVHSRMGQVLTTGQDGFDTALSGLKGYPTVVNMWASWCGPCRYEFPVLAKASLDLGRQVAFLGVATREKPSNSREFLARHPVAYPSFADEDGGIAQSAGAGPGLPVTSIYDRSGKRAYVHQGPYRTVKDLRADLIRYGGLD